MQPYDKICKSQKTILPSFQFFFYTLVISGNLVCPHLNIWRGGSWTVQRSHFAQPHYLDIITQPPNYLWMPNYSDTFFQTHFSFSRQNDSLHFTESLWMLLWPEKLSTHPPPFSLPEMWWFQTRSLGLKALWASWLCPKLFLDDENSTRPFPLDIFRDSSFWTLPFVM